ncbi:MAG TPA: glycosyltransferase [Thermoanaerobaculia bacterium]
MSPPSPSLAVVVLSLRNQAGLGAAVRSLLGQGEPLELVVVDSGGGGGAAALAAAGVPVPVIEHREVLLPGAARNAGIAATSAPWVAFLAADCRAEPGWAAARRAAHAAGHAAVASAVVNPYRRNLCAWAMQASLFAARMPGTPPEHRLLYGASYRRDLFDRCGLFREDLEGGEDSDFHQRLGHRGIAIAWEPRVRTAHDHPRSLGALLADHHRRGRRTAASLERLSHARAPWVARRVLVRVRHTLPLAWRSAAPGERRWIAAAAPLVVLAAAAYAAGALSAPRPAAASAEATR